MDASFFEVPVKVDKERVIRVDFNNLCTAEKVDGVSYLTDMNLLMTLNGMRAICFASWSQEEPDMTIEDVGRILQHHLPAVTLAFLEAVSEAQPDSEGDAVDPTKEETVAATTLPS